MITTTSLRRVPATAGAGTRVAVVVFAVLVAGWWSYSGPAGAAVLAFVLAPASGPPGTHVTVSGTGCSPGLTLSSSDFVAVAAPTFGVTVQRPVAANGSWHGTFKVPADAAAGDAPVAAVCVTDGLPSLTTLYTPQVFTVTTAAATTTTSQPPPPTTGGTTPTTPGGTTPKPGGGSTPTTRDESPPDTGGGSEPTTTVPTSDGVPSGGPSGGETGNNSGAGARPVKADGDGAPRRATPMGRAADLRAPELSAARINDMSELDWLAWTLLIALVFAAVAAPLVLRRLRGRDAPTTGDVT